MDKNFLILDKTVLLQNKNYDGIIIKKTVLERFECNEKDTNNHFNSISFALLFFV